MAKKVIIIGAGVSGLVAGIYALKAGFDVTLIEKNNKVGGLCLAYEKSGYKVDLTLHWLTGTGKTTSANKVWNEVGAFSKEQNFYRLPSLITFNYEGEDYSLLRDIDKNEKDWLNRSPEDKKYIKQFFNYVRKFGSKYKKQQNGFLKVLGYIKRGPLILKTARINRDDFANKFTNKGMSNAIKLGQYGYNSLFGLIYEYGLFIHDNADIPKGGSDTFINNIFETYKNLGGKIILNNEINGFDIKDNNIVSVMANGKSYVGDYYISAIPLGKLFDILPSKYLTKQFAKWDDNSKNKQAYIPSMFGLIFTLPLALVENLPVPYAFEVEPFNVGTQKVDKLVVRSYHYDKSCIKNNRVVVNVLIDQNNIDYEYFKQLSKQKYLSIKNNTVNDILSRLIIKFPDWGKGIEVIDHFSPLIFERECSAYKGGYMTFSINRNCMMYSHKNKIKGLNNLVLAGQWLTSPGGTPLAALNGKKAIKTLLKITK